MSTEANYHALFNLGVIAPWYLRDSQRILYGMLLDHKRVVAKAHRRFGKGTTVFVYAIERCITEKITVRYGAPTMLQAYEIINTLFEHIFHYSPQHRPKSISGGFEFPSGSRWMVFGGKDSNELDKARGSEADIIILDEFGFFNFKPKYLLESVLSPQLDTTDGQMIITSTPPIDMTHHYCNEVISSQIDGSLFSWGILDSLGIGEVTADRHAQILKRCGGEQSDSYKREYLCDMIADTSTLVIPEAQAGGWTGEQARPDFYHYCVMFDFGLRDFTHGLYYYVDFLANRMIVESELVLNYNTTKQLGEKSRAREIELVGETVKIHSRKGDCANAQQLYDLNHEYGYNISGILKRSQEPTEGYKDSIINALRVGIMSGKILINKDKCPKLYTQVMYGLWNERRTDFVKTDEMGHLDGLMALAYAYDNAPWKENPYPKSYAGEQSTHYMPKELVVTHSKNAAKLKDAFIIKKKISRRIT